jgi:hypothetical protein
MELSPLEQQFALLWDYLFPSIDLYHDYSLGLRDAFNPLDPKKKRRYRADFVHLPTRVAIEIQGGIYQSERTGHTSIRGVERDCLKISLATLHGWKVFLLSPNMIDRYTVEAIGNFIRDRERRL